MAFETEWANGNLREPLFAEKDAAVFSPVCVCVCVIDQRQSRWWEELQTVSVHCLLVCIPICFVFSCWHSSLAFSVSQSLSFSPTNQIGQIKLRQQKRVQLLLLVVEEHQQQQLRSSISPSCTDTGASQLFH